MKSTELNIYPFSYFVSSMLLLLSFSATAANGPLSISLGARFMEIAQEGQDESDGESFELGLGFQSGHVKSTLVSAAHSHFAGTWIGFDLRYQKRTNKVGYGLSYLRYIGDHREEEEFLDPLIAYVSIQLIPPRKNSL